MATTKINFLAFLLIPYVTKSKLGEREDIFTIGSAAKVIIPDAIRCWMRSRGDTHFTKNPETGMISWISFPNENVNRWTKKIVNGSKKEFYGKPQKAVIDEESSIENFWKYNSYTKQNMLFLLHFVQDRIYDNFIRTIIDTERRYEDVYLFENKEMKGSELREYGKERWKKGLLSEIDNQFYVRLAKRYYNLAGVKANNYWIETTMIGRGVKGTYSQELAQKTMKFVLLSNLSNKADFLITTCNFDSEVWPVPNQVVDNAIDKMLDETIKMLIKNMILFEA